MNRSLAQDQNQDPTQSTTAATQLASPRPKGLGQVTLRVRTGLQGGALSVTTIP
jgi:hypothetical protein